MKKVFGIGLSRTGTTSLTKILNDVGIAIVHYPTKRVLFDPHSPGACDIPVAAFYKQLDQKFPNSKFVYTVRDKTEWLTSIESYLKMKHLRGDVVGLWKKQIRLKMYGQLDFDKELFTTAYETHDRDVRRYFKHRTDDILILDICGGDPIHQLMHFVKKQELRKGSFPHMNKKKVK